MFTIIPVFYKYVQVINVQGKLTSERTAVELLRVVLDEIKHLALVPLRGEVAGGDGVQKLVAGLSGRLLTTKIKICIDNKKCRKETPET